MGTLPILLKNPEVLLVGGGSVALQKARVLLKNKIPLTLIAPETCPEIIQLGIKVIRKKLSTEDLNQSTIVVDATGNAEVAKMILAEKKSRFFLYNCVDQPDLCDFYFSSLLNYGHLKIAVSTDGYSPAIGQVVRDKISTLIPAEMEALLEKTGQNRGKGIIDSVVTREQCQKLFASVQKTDCASKEAGSE